MSADRGKRLEAKYGLPEGAWARLFAAQGRCCAVCGALEPGTRRGWQTDHCHDTGVVRGILCHGCNVAAGFLHDDPVRAAGLAEYLTIQRRRVAREWALQQFPDLAWGRDETVG